LSSPSSVTKRPETEGWVSPVTLLRRWVAGGRIGHAYLFVGQPGMGRREAALELARLLNCEALPASKAADEEAPASCRVCRSCLSIDRGVHPEVKLIAADGATTRIGQVRDVCREIRLRPAAGRRRVYVFEHADRLTAEAANALLAVLEEPPPYSVLVLLAVHAQSLLPTVLSRCHVVSFRPWPQQALARRLAEEEGVAEDQARLAAVLAQGNPGVARRLLREGELGEGRQMAQKLLEAVLAGGGGVDAYTLAAELETYCADRAGTLVFLDVLAIYLRDLVVWQDVGSPALLVNRDGEAWLRSWAASRSRDRLVADLGTVAFVREAIRQNVQRRMGLDLLVLRLLAPEGRDEACPG